MIQFVIEIKRDIDTGGDDDELFHDELSICVGSSLNKAWPVFELIAGHNLFQNKSIQFIELVMIDANKERHVLSRRSFAGQGDW